MIVLDILKYFREHKNVLMEPKCIFNVTTKLLLNIIVLVGLGVLIGHMVGMFL